jgi:hypothetical protein
MARSRRVATFAEEGKWTSGADSTMLVGDWQAWVDGEGHWKVRGPDPDNDAHYADGDIELTEAEYIEAGNSEARRKIRARRAKEAARSYIKTMTQPSKRHHATKKSAEDEYDPVGHTRGVRAREIVRLAAEQVKDPSTRYWLLADERGTFEKAARKYLEETADKARALGMTNEKVNEEIAVMLALSAIEAFLKRARKGR